MCHQNVFKRFTKIALFYSVLLGPILIYLVYPNLNYFLRTKFQATNISTSSNSKDLNVNRKVVYFEKEKNVLKKKFDVDEDLHSIKSRLFDEISAVIKKETKEKTIMETYNQCNKLEKIVFTKIIKFSSPFKSLGFIENKSRFMNDDKNDIEHIKLERMSNRKSSDRNAKSSKTLKENFMHSQNNTKLKSAMMEECIGVFESNLLKPKEWFTALEQPSFIKLEPDDIHLYSAFYDSTSNPLSILVIAIANRFTLPKSVSCQFPVEDTHDSLSSNAKISENGKERWIESQGYTIVLPEHHQLL